MKMATQSQCGCDRYVTVRSLLAEDVRSALIGLRSWKAFSTVAGSRRISTRIDNDYRRSSVC